MKPHKHAEWIKAWAEDQDLVVQYFDIDRGWRDIEGPPTWRAECQYRIKPAEPEKVYPVTSMSNKEINEIITTDEYPWVAFGVTECAKRVANTAIRRAIDDGQVVLPNSEREVEIAKAIRSEAIRRSMYGDQRIKQSICDIDCRAIIAGVK